MDHDEWSADQRARIGQAIEGLVGMLVDGDVRSMKDYHYVRGQIEGLRYALELIQPSDGNSPSYDPESEDDGADRQISIH